MRWLIRWRTVAVYECLMWHRQVLPYSSSRPSSAIWAVCDWAVYFCLSCPCDVTSPLGAAYACHVINWPPYWTVCHVGTGRALWDCYDWNVGFINYGNLGLMKICEIYDLNVVLIIEMWDVLLGCGTSYWDVARYYGNVGLWLRCGTYYWNMGLMMRLVDWAIGIFD